MRKLLIASLFLNALALAFVAQKAAHRLWPKKAQFTQTVPYRARLADCSAVPDVPGQIVFAGDSNIQLAPCAEMFSAIRNKGIGGDTTAGLLQRLDSITISKPSRIVLLIGTNDITRGVKDWDILENVSAILGRATGSGARIYIVGILPRPAGDRADRVAPLNQRIAELADASGAVYIDPSPALANGQGELKAEYVSDSVHLTSAGYVALLELIRSRMGQ